MAGQSPEQSQQAQAQPQTQPQPQAPETPSTATPREDLQTLSGAEAHRSELDPPGEG